MQYDDNIGQDTFKLYYINKVATGSKYYLARSVDYGITWSQTQSLNTQSQFESVISYPDSTNKYLAFGKWRNNISYFYHSKSTDGGFNFFDSLEVMELGEDKSFIWNVDEEEYWGYVRPYPTKNECCLSSGPCPDGVRKIALMKNYSYFGSSINWSSRNIIAEVDTNDYISSSSPDYRTQMYYMQVFRTGDDWWGLVGMYRIGNNGGATNDPPYTFPEYTTDVELMWSDDGEEWYRTNNMQPFIALHDSIKSIYTVGTKVGDSVYFYSSESTILHATHKIGGCLGIRQDSMINGKFFSIYLYKMSIDKLNEWRPPSVFEINCAVEGFLNTGTGKHNLRDTLKAELRNSTSPYAPTSVSQSVIDSVTFLGNFNFPHVSPANYYLVIYGRNSLETWSANTISVINGTKNTYDFTTGFSKAYGGNLDSTGSEFCIYSGDLNSDGLIDNNDQAIVDNDIFNVVTGYAVSDVNGDYAVDVIDGAIVENNVENFVATIRP